MYGLRLINNFYADYAGSRSDFVIVGHPEYNLGKVRSDYGYKEGWDTRGIPSLPARSIPGDRIQRAGTEKYLKSLARPEPKPKYKERVLAKSRSEPQVRKAEPKGDIDDFFQELTSFDKLPPCSPNRLTAGWANDMRSQPVMKHYNAIQEELEGLRSRVLRAPGVVKAELQSDDAWRYYALHLEQAKKNDLQLRQTKQKANAWVQKAMRGTA
ncbi:unnamed protein product [Effrenium voratum]|uniref:Uncharacterized protein n=1 Tax=Effrenium voratum TaxID=2562239 RepID=A0AA36NFK2_9DINO|nr:unnamed protein product [Effrenium voratum]CAJ1401436.1 unnamed protein product [Effrenium voratum]|mmetsp:Transcript_118368/g.280962  ORF Transcript_118368/g.280962 Transcript_118368/m.280962 type:complete len:212 (-) Transcript_118368:122-757(-)